MAKITKVYQIMAQFSINDKMVELEMDTGCSVTVLTKTEYSINMT